MSNEAWLRKFSEDCKLYGCKTPDSGQLLAAAEEIKRMRVALTELSDPLLIEGVGGYGFNRALRMISTMRDIAKAALDAPDQQRTADK